MRKLKKIDSPNGWLIDPHNKWAIHFSPKNGDNDQHGSELTIDMWGLVPNGKPMVFKSRRKATKLDSINTWNQLIESNWVEFELAEIKTA